MLIALTSCATRGNRFNVDAVPKIAPEYTTQEEIRQWFGDPTSIKVTGTGGSEWRYFFEEERTHSTGTLTKLGRSIASIFGIRAFFPPVDLEYSNTTRHTLNVQFGDDEIVDDYSYESRETPSKRVY